MILILNNIKKRELIILQNKCTNVHVYLMGLVVIVFIGQYISKFCLSRVPFGRLDIGVALC